VILWGNGYPRRELLYAPDLASAIVDIMEKVNYGDIDGIVNVGVGEDMQIFQIARKIAHVLKPDRKVTFTFDSHQPNGVDSKLLDSTRMNNLGWQPKHTFEQGIKETYEWWKSQA